MNYRILHIVFLIFLIPFLFRCTKDKVPEPTVLELNKWEIISGAYNVYDTNGVFLYEMSITHIHSNIDNSDSLYFNNFDGGLNFGETQTNSIVSNWPENYFMIGYHDTLTDTNGKRWSVTGLTNDIYNSLNQDTILLRFSKNNIHFYLEDLVPYYSCTCKQIAVKI